MSIGYKTIISAWALPMIFLLAYTSSHAQNYNPDTVRPAADYDNVHVNPHYSDSNASVFIIWVKQRVALHYHAYHTEYVTVLEGEGWFWLDGNKQHIGPGTHIIIPAGTPHKVEVTSKTPMKVVSVQTPEFTGADRILLEDEVD